MKPLPAPVERIFRAMYLGAFVALDIHDGDAAKILTLVTRTSAEAIVAIDIMHYASGPTNNRVHQAFVWLQKQRQKES